MHSLLRFDAPWEEAAVPGRRDCGRGYKQINGYSFPSVRVLSTFALSHTITDREIA